MLRPKGERNMSDHGKKHESKTSSKRTTGKLVRSGKGRVIFNGLATDSHPIYQTGSRLSLRSKPRPRPAGEESSDK
jgi:hypothetical protein